MYSFLIVGTPQKAPKLLKLPCEDVRPVLSLWPQAKSAKSGAAFRGMNVPEYVRA